MGIEDKILDSQGLPRILENWRRLKYRIVFTNGCFDLLHLGHLNYLEKARRLGDKLVVGLNSDDSVTRLKGPGRPINDEKSRSRLMASLEFVDAVVIFHEDTPLGIIGKVMPDVLVKGDDYLAGNIIGADIVKEQGGKVITVPLLEGYSSSSIIDRIKSNL